MDAIVSDQQPLNRLIQISSSGQETGPQSAGIQEASRELLGLPLQTYFPFETKDSSGRITARIRLSNPEEFSGFLQKNHEAVSRTSGGRPQFISESTTPAKQKYFEHLCDFFAFERDGRVLGVSLASVSDWSTYYLRYVFLMPELRSTGVFPAMIERLILLCQNTAVHRIEVDVSVSNLPGVKLYTSLGFNPTGTLISDRWGANLRLTRFVNPVHEKSFLQNFCTGEPYQLRPRTQETRRTK